MNDGGPAFPQDVTICSCGLVKVRTGQVFDGMSLRDWFAGMALQGMKFRAKTDDGFIEGGELRGCCAQLALAAYAVADAMLERRVESKG